MQRQSCLILVMLSNLCLIIFALSDFYLFPDVKTFRTFQPISGCVLCALRLCKSGRQCHTIQQSSWMIGKRCKLTVTVSHLWQWNDSDCIVISVISEEINVFFRNVCINGLIYRIFIKLLITTIYLIFIYQDRSFNQTTIS